jgi:hypothetical protein
MESAHKKKLDSSGNNTLQICNENKNHKKNREN